MDNNPSKTEAKIDQAQGTVKENIGQAIGNERMQAEGAAQHSSGHVEETAADVNKFFKNLADKTEGTFKGIVNAFKNK